MKTKIAIGLVMTLALGALVAAPASAEPGKSKGNGKGAVVTRGTQADSGNPCTSAVDAIVDLDAVVSADTYKWRWVYKPNGRPSKLFCRIKGAVIDDSVVDPPDRPRGNILRLRGQEALEAELCPLEPDTSNAVGELRRARLKMNAKGNGHLKCVYEPPTS